MLSLEIGELVSEGRGWQTAHLITAPHAGNPNLHAQDGVFTVFRTEAFHSEAAVERQSLVEQVASSLRDGETRMQHPIFVEFSLPVDNAQTLMWFLAREGITAARLFPGTPALFVP